jgi:hypothetical protein
MLVRVDRQQHDRKAALVVRAGNVVHRLGDDDELIFGRDSTCTLQLDSADRGVSRVAGRIRRHLDGWYVTNLSDKRVLHVVDAAGMTVPLPVTRAGWPVSRRALNEPSMTILVPGEMWTYALLIEGPGGSTSTAVPVPDNPLTTRDAAVYLTENRREVLIALARGYLRPQPHYDPQPRSYDDVAAFLGLTERQVTRRIEDFRQHLIDAGVDGLDKGRDGRQAICQWLLSSRLITHADLAWLEARIRERRDQRTGSGDVTTTQFSKLPATRIMHAAYTAAKAIAPPLTIRLTQVYGADWLKAVNAARAARNIPAGASLNDVRFCLALLAHDPSTIGWASPQIRTAAANLKNLANAAQHDPAKIEVTTDQAEQHCVTLTTWARTAAQPQQRRQ